MGGPQGQCDIRRALLGRRAGGPRWHRALSSTTLQGLLCCVTAPNICSLPTAGRGFLGDAKTLPNALKPDPPVRLQLDGESLLRPVCSCSKKCFPPYGKEHVVHNFLLSGGWRWVPKDPTD